MMHFNCALIAKLDPYFDDMKDCSTSVHNAVFSTRDFWNNTAEHQMMLKILQETYNKLPDELRPFNIKQYVISMQGCYVKCALGIQIW